MPSSPAEADAALQALARAWDEAFGAVAQGDLERARTLLSATARHLAPVASVSATPALLAAAQAAHGRLASAIERAKAATSGELARVQQGRRLLQTYAGPAPGLGRRVESRV
jgi:hypothetical protein